MNNRKENMSEIDFEKDQQKVAENTDLSALSIHVEKIMDLDKQLDP